ncbi:MAG: hypothetical protein WB493_13115 [Anaeromyxobacteraceae bacterium]
MDDGTIAVARKCLSGAEEGTMDFPAIVRTLMDAGFDGYTVDYRRATATYFLPDGDGVELPMPRTGAGVAAGFDASAIAQAVREAQAKAPGYTYAGFTAKVMAAGWAGYMVSFPGRRVLYFGRTAETHVEHFPR